MWYIEPLDGKYYGTRIVNDETDEVIEVWLDFDSASASVREIENGWEPDAGYDHVESARSYKAACVICDALNFEQGNLK